MPTDAKNRAVRFLVTGHFLEEVGYCTDRPQGCHDWLLVYTLGGTGQFSQSSTSQVTKDWSCRVQANDVILIAPQAAHRYETVSVAKPWELLWAHFVPPTEWLPWLDWPQLAKGIGHLKITSRSVRNQLVDSFQFAHAIRSSYQSHREPLAINAIESVLLWCATQNPRSDRPTVDRRIRDCLDHICRSLDQSLTVSGLAKTCHLSPSRFAHLFREQLGMTPQQFIEQQRISRAAELLEHSGYSIAQVARRVGFDDPFYFSRRFKNLTGKSPRDFRQSQH